MKQRLVQGLLACSVALTIAWSTIPLHDAQDRLRCLPAAGPGFASRDLALAPDEAAVFGQARALKRIYQVRGERFVLTVIDGSRNRHAIHDPLYCFRGAGWQVTKNDTVPIIGGHAQAVTLSKDGEPRNALFWLSDGETRYTSPFQYWWQTTLRRLTFGQSGAAPVLVMLQPAGAQALEWATLLDRFPAVFNF
jgi:hypothetical protein